MTYTSARQKLSILWFIAVGILTVILVVSSLSGAIAPVSQIDDVWSWFLPTVLPTLSLMIGGTIHDGMTGGTSNKKAHLKNTFVFNIAISLSVVYLVLVAVPFLVRPIHKSNEILPLIRMSNYWLGPLQGLVAGCVGAFFRSGVAERRSTG